jgi:hypothetical protein
MTPGDTARLLAKAAAFDQRTIGAADVAAWHEAVGDLDAGDALAAVTRHYQRTDQRIMPSHLRILTVEIGRERRKVLREAAERRALDAEATELTTDRSAEIAAFVQQIRSGLPDSDPAVLRPRAAYWDREHRAYQRYVEGEPNPFYRGGVNHDHQD